MMRAHVSRLVPAFAALLVLATAPRAARLVLEAAGIADPPVFLTGDQCIACHGQLVTPAGEDISIGFDWRASIMANSSRDPYWQAGVRREVMDHPESSELIQDECSRCHMPMSNELERRRGGHGRIFDHLPVSRPEARLDSLAADGVSCSLCHQITAENFGTPESFTGGFVVDTTRAGEHGRIFGPFEIDTGRITIMRSATGFRPTEAAHIQTSEHCATCHVLYTTALGPGGEVIARLPEQTPYQEWLNSAYRGVQTCQDCHMPPVADSTAITAVLGQPRPDVSRHTFVGGNFFMLRMLNRYRDELGVQALPQELDALARATEEFLRTRTARVAVERAELAGGRLDAVVAIENLTGHKLPTAYPSRRAWLHVAVYDRDGSRIFESGALRPDGSIVGNANDDDPARYEPHHDVIDSADQVQVYESIMIDTVGAVTTGLLTGVRYVKDNRLLPHGFDKAHAHEDVAVYGAAANDADFQAGADRVRYRVDLAGAQGPFRVEARLWYQPISFRWANNLRPYDAFETQRFVGYYDAMAGVSAIVLAEDSAVVR
jgi:hypothetical protein